MQNFEVWYTDGPSSHGIEEQLFEAGATGSRLTFSFSTCEYHAERAKLLKEAAARVNRPCKIVADLAGEKIRLGTFEGEHSVPVEKGDRVRFVLKEATKPQARKIFPIPNLAFFENVRENDQITIGDGSAVVKVTKRREDEVFAEVLGDGIINQKRGLNIQGDGFQPNSITPKDFQDLKFILSDPVFDAVALSFVSSIADLKKVELLSQKVGRKIPIVAKIESSTGVQNIDQICESADYVMAARGDLALNIPWVDLPGAVLKIASTATEKRTKWILATQIMEGLERFAIPTRAEICDLAHWVQMGCAGILLSYETVFGN